MQELFFDFSLFILMGEEELCEGRMGVGRRGKFHFRLHRASSNAHRAPVTSSEYGLGSLKHTLGRVQLSKVFSYRCNTSIRGRLVLFSVFISLQINSENYLDHGFLYSSLCPRSTSKNSRKGGITLTIGLTRKNLLCGYVLAILTHCWSF